MLTVAWTHTYADIVADSCVLFQAAEAEYERLRQDGVLGDAQCGLLHGRMAGEEKIAALQRFANGETPVLISTTVVEVRIDRSKRGMDPKHNCTRSLCIQRI